MERKTSILIAAAVIILVLIGFFIYKLNTTSTTTSERYQMIFPSLQSGTYLIQHNGKVFASTAFTPIVCDDWTFEKARPSPETSWTVKKVTDGVYMLQKPGGKECLYTHIDGSLKSYLLSDCDRKNLCGTETLDSYGELDRYSIRSYFKIMNAPEQGKYIMQSLQNNKYICMINGKPNFTDKVDPNCYFEFKQI